MVWPWCLNSPLYNSVLFICSGFVSPGDLSAVCKSEAILPQQLAHLPPELPLTPEGTLTLQPAQPHIEQHTASTNQRTLATLPTVHLSLMTVMKLHIKS